MAPIKIYGLPTVRPSAVVDCDHENQAAAKTLWPGEDPIGKRVRFLLQDWDVSVIGVVTDVTYARVTEAPQPIIYAPLKQHLSSQATVYVNVTGDVDAAAKTIRSSVTSLEPALSSTRIRTGKQVLDQVLTRSQRAAPNTADEQLLKEGRPLGRQLPAEVGGQFAVGVGPRGNAVKLPLPWPSQAPRPARNVAAQ